MPLLSIPVKDKSSRESLGKYEMPTRAEFVISVSETSKFSKSWREARAETPWSPIAHDSTHSSRKVGRFDRESILHNRERHKNYQCCCSWEHLILRTYTCMYAIVVVNSMQRQEEAWGLTCSDQYNPCKPNSIVQEVNMPSQLPLWPYLRHRCTCLDPTSAVFSNEATTLQPPHLPLVVLPKTTRSTGSRKPYSLFHHS